MDTLLFATFLVRKYSPLDKRLGVSNEPPAKTGREMQDECDEIDRELGPLSCCSIRHESKGGVIVVALGYASDEAAVRKKLYERDYDIVDYGKIAIRVALTIEKLCKPLP